MKINQLGLILMVLLVIYMGGKQVALNQHILHLTNLKNESDSLYQWQSERLLNYTLMSLELNNECDKFQSSRNSKAKNKTISELIDKLN